MRLFFTRALIASLIFFTWISSSQADEFVVADIEVKGLQRVSPGTLFAASNIEVGDKVDALKLREAIRTIFKTGLFTDIATFRDGDVLIFQVKERPSINKIELKGNSAIPTDQLKLALKNAGMEEGQIFKRATMDRLELEILRAYVAQGRYNARVKAEVTDLPRNRVEVLVNIAEGKVAAIHHLNFIGNQSFDDETLSDLFELKATSLWNDLFSNDKYAREKLSGDLEKLRSFYLDRGFIKFSVESTQVSISPDKKQVFITVSINEGPRYTLREILLKGDLIVPEAEMKKLILVKPGEVFSRQKLTANSEILSRRLGNEGYTFASVDPVPETHEDNTATITFFVDPGKRTYVRRINYSGNVSTRDDVLRQEMVQMEGAVASTDLIELSKTRLERLGYFKTVNVETPPVPGLPDQVDVNYAVEEQATGSLSASLGFSQSSGIILGGNIAENNFFGTGKRVSIGANVSDVIKSANFSYLNPYYTVDGVSRGFSLSARQTNFDEQNISDFVLDSVDARVTFGYPIDGVTRINFGLALANDKVNIPNDFAVGSNRPAQEIRSFIAEQGDSFNSLQANVSWVRNTLNKGVLPTRGLLNSLSAEVNLPGSDLSYYRLTHRADFYAPIDRGQKWVVRLRSREGFARSLAGNNEFPFFQHFFSGGFGSIRGYEANTLGPKSTPDPLDPSTPDPFGGNVLIEASAELIFPLPFMKEQDQLRSTLFIDGGNVFDTQRGFSPELGEIRYAAGISFQWITVVGPIGLSFAQPFNDQQGDDTQAFQFSLGQQF